MSVPEVPKAIFFFYYYFFISQISLVLEPPIHLTEPKLKEETCGGSEMVW